MAAAAAADSEETSDCCLAVTVGESVDGYSENCLWMTYRQADLSPVEG